MKCLKCGAYVYTSDKFCRSCGATLNSDTCKYGDNIANSKYDSSSCHEKQYSYSYEYSNKTKPTYNMNATHQEQYNYSTNQYYDPSKYDYAYKPNDSGDDKYIKAYIGQNYTQIKNMKFSLPALLFGPWYLIYRKVWGYAFGALIISLAASILLESNLADVVSLIIKIYFGFKFREIYLKQAEDKVESIKQQNLDKSTTELLAICKKKGGASIKILATLFFIIISVAVCLTAYFGATGDYTTNQSDEETTNYAYSTKFNDLYYKLPSGYSETYSSNNYQKSSNGICSITVEKRTPYGINYDPDTYLNTITVEGASEIHTINYNNHEWKYKDIHSTTAYQSIYAYKYNETLYLITLDNINYYSCNTQYNQILQTLHFTQQ